MIHLLTAYVAKDKTTRALEGSGARDPQRPIAQVRGRWSRRRTGRAAMVRAPAARPGPRIER